MVELECNHYFIAKFDFSQTV